MKKFEDNHRKGELLEGVVYDARKILLQDRFGAGDELLGKGDIVRRLMIPSANAPEWTLTWYHPRKSWDAPSIPDLIVTHSGRVILQEEAKNWHKRQGLVLTLFESHIAERFKNQPDCPNRNLVISHYNPSPESADAITVRLNELHIEVLELGKEATEVNYDEIMMILDQPKFKLWIDNLGTIRVKAVYPAKSPKITGKTMAMTVIDSTNRHGTPRYGIAGLTAYR